MGNSITKNFFLALAVLTGCFYTHRTSGQTTGHLLIKPKVDQQAAKKIKSDILQLNDDLFKTGKFTGDNKETINYRILIPAAVAGRKNYPLVLIFPSSGGIGTDNLNQLKVLPKFWAQPSVRNKYPAYVVAVQFAVRSSNYSKNPDSLLVSVPAPCLLSVLQLVDSLKRTLSVDPDRIYAVGFSMGASTANSAMTARPDLFAAGICISGIPMQEGSFRLKSIPLWLIHGNSDTENPIPGDRVFYKKMSGFKHSSVVFWEIEGLEHEIYPPLYTTDIIPKWLFARKKKKDI